MKSLSFTQLFSILTLSLVAFFLASYLSAWSGPTQAPPSGNVAAPINVGTASQVKDGTVGFNGLAVFGNTIFSGSNRYANFGSTAGESGYGLRDSSGTLEYKNSGGSWQALGSGGGGGNEGVITATTLSFVDAKLPGASWTQTSNASFTMSESAKGMLTVYANVCVGNNATLVVTLKVDGVARNVAYHRDAAVSGGVTCTVEPLTYISVFSAGSHSVNISASGTGGLSSDYSSARVPAVQGHVLYPLN